MEICLRRDTRGRNPAAVGNPVPGPCPWKACPWKPCPWNPWLEISADRKFEAGGGTVAATTAITHERNKGSYRFKHFHFENFPLVPLATPAEADHGQSEVRKTPLHDLNSRFHHGSKVF